MTAVSGSLKIQHFLNKLIRNHTLGPIVMDICELIRITEPDKFDEVRLKQRKLSEVTDMIHAAHVFHRTVRNQKPQKHLQDQDGILSLLVGDYLLARSSVDMASLRVPKTVGLIAKGLEDYTHGEFLRLSLTEKDGLETDVSGSNLIKNYVESTCGSLLANACLSAYHLAGHTDESSQLASLVYEFGLCTGSAQRLIEVMNYPNEDDKAILNTLPAKTLESYVKCYLEQSSISLAKLPDGRTKPRLAEILSKMLTTSTQHSTPTTQSESDYTPA